MTIKAQLKKQTSEFLTNYFTITERAYQAMGISSDYDAVPTYTLGNKTYPNPYRRLHYDTLARQQIANHLVDNGFVSYDYELQASIFNFDSQLSDHIDSFVDTLCGQDINNIDIVALWQDYLNEKSNNSSGKLVDNIIAEDVQDFNEAKHQQYMKLAEYVGFKDDEDYAL